MFKRLKIWLVLLLVGAGITAGGAGYMKYQEHKEREAMLEIVKSEEARERYQTLFKNLDKDAFAENGIIQSYEIDEESVAHNPMGGVLVKLYINGKENLYVVYNLNKDINTGKFMSGSSTISPDLSTLLKESSDE
ncbi:DUF1310 family protein [Streptococcus chenjunshii]|uniref:DUF1310 family protein n=3 Tax=Streptococcus chenjunshii TaxID=2173853 RepID=A0A346NB41_9STRE|nr:DUF1310 family protein [Streptococcus chenjunshii]